MIKTDILPTFFVLKLRNRFWLNDYRLNELERQVYFDKDREIFYEAKTYKEYDSIKDSDYPIQNATRWYIEQTPKNTSNSLEDLGWFLNTYRHIDKLFEIVCVDLKVTSEYNLTHFDWCAYPDIANKITPYVY